LTKWEKTITRSFRISSTAFEALEEDARRRRISVNTLVNYQLTRYAVFDRFLDKVRIVRIPASVVRRIFESVTEEEAVDMGKWLADDLALRNVMAAKDGELTVESAIAGIRGMADYNGFEHTDIVQGRKRTITMIHDLGPRFSQYLASYFHSLFLVVGAKPHFSSDARAIVFELPSPAM